MKTKKLYIAGKIAPWREIFIAPEHRTNSFYKLDWAPGNHREYIHPDYLKWYAGPFHSKDQHLIIGELVHEEHTHQRNLQAIDNCDTLVAYITTKDCFGTIYEIGYAKAKGKQVVILFDSRLPKSFIEDMWFVTHGLNTRVIKEADLIKNILEFTID